MNKKLWTVVRFPAGMWSYGGDPSSPDYHGCEVYLIPAERGDGAVKKAQGLRSRMVKAGKALPSQSEPYRPAAPKA